MRPQFDVRKFYANLITFDDEDLATMSTNGMLDIEAAHMRLQELMRRIR